MNGIKGYGGKTVYGARVGILMLDTKWPLWVALIVSAARAPDVRHASVSPRAHPMTRDRMIPASVMIAR